MLECDMSRSAVPRWSTVASLWSLPLTLLIGLIARALFLYINKARALLPERALISWLDFLCPIVVASNFVLHPLITDELARNGFDCENLANPGEHMHDHRLRSDMDILCWEGNHRVVTGLSLFGLIIYSLGLPIFFFLCMWLHHWGRATSSSWLAQMPNFDASVKWLSDGFEPGWFWYQSVFMLRRMLIIIVGRSPAFDNRSRALRLTITGCMCMLLHIACSPFDNRSFKLLDTLEMVGLLSFTVTAVAQEYQVSAKEPIGTALLWIMAVCIYLWYFFMLVWTLGVRKWMLRAFVHHRLTVMGQDMRQLQGARPSTLSDHVFKPISPKGFWLTDEGDIVLTNLSVTERMWLKLCIGEFLAFNLEVADTLSLENFVQISQCIAWKVLEAQMAEAEGKAAMVNEDDIQFADHGDVSEPATTCSKCILVAPRLVPGCCFSQTARKSRWTMNLTLANQAMTLQLASIHASRNLLASKKAGIKSTMSVEEYHEALVDLSFLILRRRLLLPELTSPQANMSPGNEVDLQLKGLGYNIVRVDL